MNIANIVPAPITPYEMVARYDANQAALLGVVIIGILLLAFTYWPREPRPVYVSLDEDGPDEPEPRTERWFKVDQVVDPKEFPDGFWDTVDDILDTFMVVDITDEMDEVDEDE